MGRARRLLAAQAAAGVEQVYLGSAGPAGQVDRDVAAEVLGLARGAHSAVGPHQPLGQLIPAVLVVEVVVPADQPRTKRRTNASSYLVEPMHGEPGKVRAGLSVAHNDDS